LVQRRKVRARPHDVIDDLTVSARAVFKTLTEQARETPFSDPDFPLVLEWRDVEGICRASGLSKALSNVRQTARRHRDDPVFHKLANRLTELSPEDIEGLSAAFLARVEGDPLFQSLKQPGHLPNLETLPREMLDLSRALSLSTQKTLMELGLTEAEIEHLDTVLNQVSDPLVDLSEVYLAPRTLGQRLRRYYYLQRIGFKALGIIAAQPFRRLTPPTHLQSQPALARRRPNTAIDVPGTTISEEHLLESGSLVN
jgi:hypothetical protein